VTMGLLFASDGKTLFFAGQDGITAIQSETGELLTLYQTNGYSASGAIDTPYNFVFSNDGTELYITSMAETSEVFNVSTQKREPFPLCFLNIAASGKYGACSDEQTIVIFDLLSGEKIQSVDIDTSNVGDMFTLNPNSDFLAYYGKTGINIVDIKTSEIMAEIPFTDFGIAETGIVEIDGVKKYAIATLTYSGQVEIYDIQIGTLIRTLRLDCCAIDGFNFAPDRKTFATLERNKLHFWDLQTGDVIYELDLKDKYAGPIAFSPNGSSVFLTRNGEGNIVELDLTTGKVTNQGMNSYAYYYADPFAVENYHFNDLGNLIVFGYENNQGEHQPSFQDVMTKEKITLPVDIKIDPDFVEAYSLSPDGQYIAYGSPTAIFVWNVKTLKLQSELKGHEARGADGWYGSIRSLSFNPQSNLLASEGWDGTVRLWSARFGNELRRLNVHGSVEFTPDGRYLVTFGDGVAYVWGIP